MSPIGDGWHAFLAILAAAVLPTAVWRWIGVALGRRIDPESEVLHWVRAVATAIIAAFVGRVVFFPTGGLAGTPLWLRLLAMAIGIAIILRGRQLLVPGVAAGIVTLIVGQALLSS
jgi:branched-subunit amino acid transport protein